MVVRRDFRQVRLLGEGGRANVSSVVKTLGKGGQATLCRGEGGLATISSGLKTLPEGKRQGRAPVHRPTLV